jgi:cation transport regulator ChaC
MAECAIEQSRSLKDPLAKGIDRMPLVFDKARHAGSSHLTAGFLSPMLYFAYGSNMDEHRLMAADRCPNARFIFNAVLPSYRLVFIRGATGASAVDAVPDANAAVWGVVYDITESDRRQLDARESVASRTYRPKEVLVHPHGDREQQVMVLTYAAREPADAQQPPSREYLDHVLSGARRWGLPSDYIAQLERVRTSDRSAA